MIPLSRVGEGYGTKWKYHGPAACQPVNYFSPQYLSGLWSLLPPHHWDDLNYGQAEF